MSTQSALFDVSGHLAFITGSTRGLGAAFAQGLIAAGARVILHGSDPARAQQAAAALGAEGAIGFDMANKQAVATGVQELLDTYGTPNILVNNAGIQRRHPINEFPDNEWEEILGVNLGGVFHVTKPIAAAMAERGNGKIIMIGSVQSKLGRATIAPYCATKGGVAMFAQGLAAELSPQGIQVNTLSPGYFTTELNAPLVADEEFSAWVTGRTPAGRWGDPAELIGPLLFLASPASDFVTGHNLFVDGGLTAVV